MTSDLKFRSGSLGLAILLAVLASPSAASAQYTVDEFDNADLLSTSTTVGTAVVMGVVWLTVVQARKGTAELRLFLDANEQEIRQGLALGGGPALADLAAIFGVSDVDVPRWCIALRRRGAALERAAYQKRDVEEFLREVVAAMAAEPALRPYLQAANEA